MAEPFDLATIFRGTDDHSGIAPADFIAAAESLVDDQGATYVPEAEVFGRVLDGHSATAEDRLDVSAGGLLVGPGGEREDLIPCIAPYGAAIINAAAVRLTGNRLQRIADLVAAKNVRLLLSPGEFVLRPDVSATLGPPMVDVLNDIGNDVHGDLIGADGEAVRLLQDKLDELIAGLESGTAPLLGEEVRAAVGLGVALGAAVDEINRQKQQERLDRADARAEEMAPVQRQYYQNAVAQQGIGLTKVRQQQADDDAVRQHLSGWKAGRDKIAAGDYGPLLDGIESQYNKQAGPFADGATVVPQSTPQGLVLNHLDKDGNPLGATRPLTPDMAVKLYDEGMKMQFKFLSPAMYDKAERAAADQAKADADRTSREKIAAGHDEARAYGADVRADATTEAADIRAKAARDAAATRAARPAGPKGLTLAQERANAEIEAARTALDGMDEAEIKRRTARATNTGRENPDFDPNLARQMTLAGRRMVGKDDRFDSQRGGRPAPDTFAGKTVADMTDEQLQRFSGLAGADGKAKIVAEQARRRFAGDPVMQGHNLGEMTPKGYKVFDSQGRHVGYYR